MTAKSLRSLAAGLFTAGLLALSAPVTAADDDQRWYDIEVIVFAHAEPAVDSEVWPIDPGLPPLEGAVSLRRPRSEDLVDFGRLRDGELKLTDAWKHLERSQHQRPIAHFGWRQLGLGREQAEAVRLSVERGEPVSLRPAPPPRGATSRISRGDGTAAPQPDRAPETDPDLLVQGTVRLIMERYLHLETDLVYQPLLAEPARHDPPAPPEDESEGLGEPDSPVRGILSGFFARQAQPGPKAPEPEEYLRFTRSGEVVWPFRMNQRRRMRSGEVHYLDHPMFGLLVLARPYEPPKPQTTADAARR